jgi:hypothetical protein
MSSHSGSSASQLANVDWSEFVTTVRDAWEAQGYETTYCRSKESAAVFELTQTDSGLSLHRMCVAVQGDTETPLQQARFNEYLDFAVSVSDGGAIEFVTTSPVEAHPDDWNGSLPVTVHSGETLDELFGTDRGDEASHNGDRDVHSSSETDGAVGREGPRGQSAESTVQITQHGGEIETSTAGETLDDDLFEFTVTAEQYVELPRPLAVDSRRRVIAGVAGICALVLIWNPTGTVVPIEVLGTLLGLGAIGVLRYPESMWATIARERARLGTFETSEVRRLGKTIQYVRDGRTTLEFGAAESTGAAQRALLFGALDAAVESPLPKTAPGTIPTPIATEGPLAVAAYRVAAHEAMPDAVSGELGIDRSTLDEYVESLVGQYAQT